jgi:hypothetical protein
MGADVNIRGRSGLGAQLALVHDQQGDMATADQFFLNIGATWWVGEQTAAAVRAALYTRCEDAKGEGCAREGERSLFFTLRTFI